jgi:ABC-type bacteriocin/lantibiotic exporter with double-glycine peptidase domain
MRTKIKSIIECVPLSYRKKLLPLFAYSLGNVFLDLLSIAYLLPFLILALDTHSKFENKYLQFIFQKEQLAYSILLLIVFFVAKNAISIRVIKYQNKLVYAISSEISKNYTQSFISSNYLFYQNQDKGDMIKNTIEVPNNFVTNVLLSLNTICCESIIIAIIAATALFLFPIIASFVILLSLVALFAIYGFRKLTLKDVSKSLSTDYRNNVNYLLDLINGFFEIKSNSKEAEFLEKFNNSNRKLNKTHSFLSTMKNSNAKYIEIIIIFIISLLLFYLVTNSDQNQKNVLLISFMASGFFKLIPSLNKLIIATSSIRSFNYTIDTILKNTAPNTDSIQNESEIRFQNHLKVENISFAYNEGGKLINDVSFQLNKGEIMGISGRSGTGKTTLLHIILKLIEPNSGKITLDGLEITQANKNSFLKLMGYVTQDPYIFSGTILENIAIGETKENIDFEKINNLIDVIGFEEVIKTHPDGIHAVTGHNGQKLSGGQKQKLAIIRALYSNPKILILDEATNQLDQENELKILNYIRELTLKENLTVLLISHDNKVLACCDTIYQFQKGILYEI